MALPGLAEKAGRRADRLLTRVLRLDPLACTGVPDEHSPSTARFIATVGGAAAWPLAARAQQDRVRRIGVLWAGDENGPLAKPYLSAFTQALAGLGWNERRNVRMDLRWAGGERSRRSRPTSDRSA